MQKAVFSIRKSFLLPLGLVVLLTLVLLVTCIYLQLPLAKTLILGAFILPAIILFAESSRRRISIGETDIQIDKLFRSKLLNYQDLTSIDTVLVRKRAFVSLKQLLARVPESVISAETRQLATNPPEKSSDVFSAWVAVAVLVLIIYVQLRGAF